MNIMATMIKDFVENTYINEQLLVSSLTKSTASNGKPYLRIGFKDASGQINGVKWNINEDDLNNCVVGNVLLVSGRVETYKSIMQLDIDEIKSIEDNQIDLTKFIKPCPVNPDELIKKLDYFINSINDVDCKKIVSEIFKLYRKDFVVFPAAISVHHDFSSGLLYHTISMAEIGEYLSKHYSNVNKDLLISGILLHDVGKTIEFESGTAYKYSLQGKLLGHITIMSAIIDEVALKFNITSEAPMLLKHMVLSHHGEYEFGSPVLPQTKEAILLNLIDNLDSKMAIVDKALEDVKNGEYSSKIFPLDGRILYKNK